ncbi:Phospholipase/carboxylesterase [Neolentinus lepideus HHB14362 ss-1]|uniref:Acyl-protein thioesterase 1 n=1 Tax=Neolentinus lepideus HHB14362 ss-1 TaxID=1314782 RepID=A0A165VBL8_9AGAM|nr:Phospholipase/carboxylesterase [Neolentinus lepideus HHB14362 ss-1]
MAGVLQPLKVLTVAPRTKHTATVIFVHGLGDSGHGWKPVADMFQADQGLGHVKWILPHSPTRAVTANMGMELPSWFDIRSFGFDSVEDEEGMMQSVSSLEQLISQEVKGGIDPSRIILGGFSQGGAMSLLTGFTVKPKLASIVVLSGWLPLREKIKNMILPHATSLPIFWGHGVSDPLIKYQFATGSIEVLESQLGMKVTRNPGMDGKNKRVGTVPTDGGVVFNSYDGVGHFTTQKELDDVRDWLKQLLPEKLEKV